MVGLELIELANLASELTDEIVAINAMSVTTFSWLFWEVSVASRRTVSGGLCTSFPALVDERGTSACNS